jgi:hypothetical protein
MAGAIEGFLTSGNYKLGDNIGFNEYSGDNRLARAQHGPPGGALKQCFLSFSRNRYGDMNDSHFKEAI